MAADSNRVTIITEVRKSQRPRNALVCCRRSWLKSYGPDSSLVHQRIIESNISDLISQYDEIWVEVPS